LQDHPRVDQLRVTGTIAAMNIVTPNPTGYLNQVGASIRQQATELGLLLRPLGNVLYLLPPYCITDDELVSVYGTIGKILDQL
jgi:adenosylmethionine---8-amino-7-oxononanoate aminotransferase